MNWKNNIIITVALLSVTLTSFGQIQDRNPDGMQTIDRVVAQIGDNIILYSDIEMQKMQLMAQEQEIQMTRDIDCLILEQLLFQNLLLNQAKIDSVRIDDAQVNADMENRLGRIEQQIGGREELEQFYNMSYAQIKDEFREVVRERLLSDRMEQVITSDVSVTPRDVKRFFERIPADSLPMVGEQMAYQQIVVYPKVSERAKSTAKDELRKIKTDIERGTRDFKTTAISKSDDKGSAKNGGLIEASRGMMVRPFEAAAMQLNVGEISDVVETQFGFHIIQLVDRKGDNYTVRHILKIPEIDRTSISTASRIIDECRNRLRDGEITWNDAVKEYSDHQLSRQNQGNVVNPYSGERYWETQALQQIDPPAYQALARMEKGDISEVVNYMDYQSGKEGFRIIRLNDKTEPHQANLKDDYNLIKQAALNLKKEEKTQKWVMEKTKSTFIKIDDKYDYCNYSFNW